MCGVLALILGHMGNEANRFEAAATLHEAMYYLQHRGQDSAGIACAAGGRVFQCKGSGIASKVFDDGKRIQELPGWMGVAHLRYPTAGTKEAAESQPFYSNSPFAICLAHNGNLTNAPELRYFLDRVARRHINTNSDSELMLNVFANELNETGVARAEQKDVFAALSRAYKRCKGAWACTAMIAGLGILAFRDPYGIRPLILGERESETLPGTFDYMIASESVALRQLGFHKFRDILPGEAVFVEKGLPPVYCQVEERQAYAPDIFEFVYFARPDSVIDGISVHASRRQMGLKLADKIKAVLTAEELADIDAVIPIPETSKTAAFHVSQRLGLPYCEAFVKNRYVFRTFIMPTQGVRQKSVRRKLSAIDEEFVGKCVLLIDDSLVRGTTSKEIVSMAREAGARRVIFGLAAPPITNPHIYGINLATHAELIASDKDRFAIAKAIDADSVIFQDLDDLRAACSELCPPDGPKEFEVGVFCGEYVTGAVPDGYFEHMAEMKVMETRNAGLITSGQVASSGPTAVMEELEMPLANGAATI